MKSIVQADKECFICGKRTGLESHHIFGGIANRKISEKYGLKVWLCREHHRGDISAHFHPEIKWMLHTVGQKCFEESHTRSEFIALFGRNYLD